MMNKITIDVLTAILIILVVVLLYHNGSLP